MLGQQRMLHARIHPVQLFDWIVAGVFFFGIDWRFKSNRSPFFSSLSPPPFSAFSHAQFSHHLSTLLLPSPPSTKGTNSSLVSPPSTKKALRFSIKTRRMECTHPPFGGAGGACATCASSQQQGKGSKGKQRATTPSRPVSQQKTTTPLEILEHDALLAQRLQEEWWDTEGGCSAVCEGVGEKGQSAKFPAFS